MRHCTVRRILARAIALFILLIASITAQPTASYAATNPLYINARLTEPTTKVGQVPKVVQTYGNNGSNPLKEVEAFCEYSKLSSTWPIDLNFNAIDRPQNMIPGQNTNRETAIRTIAPGQVEVFCQVSGRDTVTNEQFTAFAAPVKLTINP